MDTIAERYLRKKSLAPKAIHAVKVASLGKNTSQHVTVKRWVKAFKRGRECHEDAPVREGLSLWQPPKQSLKSMVWSWVTVRLANQIIRAEKIIDDQSCHCER